MSKKMNKELAKEFKNALYKQLAKFKGRNVDGIHFELYLKDDEVKCEKTYMITKKPESV